MARAIEMSALQALLAIRGIARGAFADKASQILDKLFARGEAADAQRQQDPAASMARLTRVLRELLADLESRERGR